MEETAQGEEFAVCARKIIQQDYTDTSQRAKNQWQEAVKAVKKNQLIVEDGTIQEDVISMCVVPVKVKHKDSNFVYSTFTMLDNCSQDVLSKQAS